MSTELARTRRKCDDLARKLVREREGFRCQRCGMYDTACQAAHVIKRGVAWTRCELDNIWMLCKDCHTLVDNDQVEWWLLVAATIGMGRVEKMNAQAREHTQSGLKGVRFWKAELARLRTIASEAAS